MSSKSKRRVTVDTGNTVSEDSEKRKPSVFERLGPGAGQRKYSEYDSEVDSVCLLQCFVVLPPPLPPALLLLLK